MNILIRKDALELLFKVLLSCKCPLTSDQEQAIYSQLSKLENSETLYYNELLNIFSYDASTVIHRLADFSLWFCSAEAQEMIIEREHVLRHFASSYHWDHVVGQNMDKAYRKVISIPKWFIGHMLLPAEIITDKNNNVIGKYRFDDGEIKLKNLFLPPEFNIPDINKCCVHFASVLTPLSPKEESLICRLIDMNRFFVQCRQEIDEIDYLNFERFGNYAAIAAERHKKYF